MVKQNGKQRRRLKALIKAHLRAREKGREKYRTADAKLAEIRQIMRIGERCKIDESDPVVLVDLYAASDKVFRSHGIGRFELQRVDPLKAIV